MSTDDCPVPRERGILPPQEVHMRTLSLSLAVLVTAACQHGPTRVTNLPKEALIEGAVAGNPTETERRRFGHSVGAVIYKDPWQDLEANLPPDPSESLRVVRARYLACGGFFVAPHRVLTVATVRIRRLIEAGEGRNVLVEVDGRPYAVRRILETGHPNLIVIETEAEGRPLAVSGRASRPGERLRYLSFRYHRGPASFTYYGVAEVVAGTAELVGKAIATPSGDTVLRRTYRLWVTPGRCGATVIDADGDVAALLSHVRYAPSELVPIEAGDLRKALDGP